MAGELKGVTIPDFINHVQVPQKSNAMPAEPSEQVFCILSDEECDSCRKFKLIQEAQKALDEYEDNVLKCIKSEMSFWKEIDDRAFAPGALFALGKLLQRIQDFSDDKKSE